MDNLVLIRVAAALDRELRQCVLRGVRAEGRHRYRWLFERSDRLRSVVVSLRPELPWIGRPAGRVRYPVVADRFAAACAKSLAGAVVQRVHKPSADRLVRIEFADGAVLVAELATHGANLVLLDRSGRVAGSARSPKKARTRISIGGDYRPPSLPGRLLDPFAASAEQIDSRLEDLAGEGVGTLEGLRRQLFGIGRAGAELVVREAAERAVSPGSVLVRRIAQLREGGVDPVLEAPEDPVGLAREGRLEPDRLQLWPWPVGDGARAGDGPAATAGIYHEALELASFQRERVEGLLAILDAESRRLWAAQQQVTRDLDGFENPELHRIRGEALLAGMREARRDAGHVTVPDPYGGGSDLVIPVPHGVTLAREADRCFARHRRARRGLERGRRRLAMLNSRREGLEQIRLEADSGGGEAVAQRLEDGLREAGIPVGLSRGKRDTLPATPSRIDGLRMFRSSAGEWILVGRSGKGNDHLTFKIARPDDFWLHAAGRPGAHVVVRNPTRSARPQGKTLEEAAAVAAWYSQGRDESRLDVQWTRRRNVRRARGASPGTVTIKRYETIRVRPRSPDEEQTG